VEFAVEAPGARLGGVAALEPGGQWVVPPGAVFGLRGLLGLMGVPGGVLGLAGLLAGALGLPIGAAMPVMAMAPKSNPARVAGKYLITFSLLVDGTQPR
jgi:hypothetical protein